MQVRKKSRWLKRLALVGLVAGAVAAARRVRAGRANVELGPPASWPPLTLAPDPPVATVGDLARDAAPATPPATTPRAAADDSPVLVHDPEDIAAWVPALEDGSCPASHPVKANKNSRIFHEPGGRFYERTQAERCYVDAAAAATDGYRAAKGANGPDRSGEER